MVVLPKVSISTDLNEGLCFGCGHNNPIGLKLRFTKEGETCRAEFTPASAHQGWPGIVHGGILACVLDEAMSYAVYFEGVTCLTANMQVRLKQPAKVEEPLVITSSVTKNRKKLLEARAQICRKDGTVVAESTSKQFVIENEAGHGGVSKEPVP
jgi:acyl-coenzyme A thioesterase PaaI-like protein